MLKQKLWIALVSAALLVGASPASAETVTNTFVGTIVYADNTGFDPTTTSDVGKYFGGGNLLGATFTLTMTLDSSQYFSIDDPSSPSFINGGTYYSVFSGNPISVSLTINGDTISINDSSDAFYGDQGYGPNEKYLQAFNYVNQLQSPGVVVDLSTLAPDSITLTTPLSAMYLSDNTFVDNYASFYDNANGEVLNLNVESVNVAEPGSLASLIAGLLVLPLILRRRTD